MTQFAVPPPPEYSRRDSLAPYGRTPLKPAGWPPAAKLRNERLVWLAAKPEIERLAKPWWLQLMSGVGPRSNGQAHRARKELGGHRMREYALACDAVAKTLTPEELDAVRQSAQLPPWFFPAVKQIRGEQIAYMRSRR